MENSLVGERIESVHQIKIRDQFLKKKSLKKFKYMHVAKLVHLIYPAHMPL